jgi:hypothetical protein
MPALATSPVLPTPVHGPTTSAPPDCYVGATTALDMGRAVVSGYWLGSGPSCCCGVLVAGNPSEGGQTWLVSLAKRPGLPSS